VASLYSLSSLYFSSSWYGNLHNSLLCKKIRDDDSKFVVKTDTELRVCTLKWPFPQRPSQFIHQLSIILGKWITEADINANIPLQTIDDVRYLTRVYWLTVLQFSHYSDKFKQRGIRFSYDLFKRIQSLMKMIFQ